MKKIVIGIGAGILCIVLLFIAYLELFFPRVGKPQNITINATPQVLQRGEYLVLHVAGCVDCHSRRDWSRLTAPVIPGTEGEGGEVFDKRMGFPGTFYAANITPYGIHDWTDGELYRLITTGVKKDGEPIFPVMPYQSYAHMDPKDVIAVIAYIRTLKPVQSDVPASKPAFPMNLIMRTIPGPASPEPVPPSSDRVSYGKYLVTVGACADCHTPQEKGAPIKGMYLAGGFAFRLPGGGTVYASNITPDKETGIGTWTEDSFVRRFKMYGNPAVTGTRVGKDEFNTIMPWTVYAGMTEPDLKAVYAYLMSVAPVRHRVERFKP